MYQLGLIGYPIEHSLSPWIHRNFLKRAGIEGEYKLFEIKPEDAFNSEIMRLKENVDGFNITVPYKEKIIPYLDELDEVAKEMQAVNTVINKNGKWIGYNTDGIGYTRSLESAYPSVFQNKAVRILILGAGGAARAIYYALTREGFNKVDIANRTLEKAKDIQTLSNNIPSVETSVYSIDDVQDSLGKYDLIIQTTSVGMKNVSLEPIVTINELKRGAIVSDIVYQPIETELLKDAKKHNGNVLHGHTMLLYQAQAAFEIWTGTKVDAKEMERELLHELEGR